MRIPPIGGILRCAEIYRLFAADLEIICNITPHSKFPYINPDGLDALGIFLSSGAEGAKEAVDLLARINTYYFDGSYTEIHRLLRENRGTLRKIKKNTQNYDSSYVRSIIEVEKEDQHSLLIER